MGINSWMGGYGDEWGDGSRSEVGRMTMLTASAAPIQKE